MPTFSQMLENYLRVTVSYWWLLLLGATMPFIDGINWHLPEGRKLKLKPWHRLTITFIFLSAAQFLAYKNSQSNLYQVIAEKQQSSIEKNNLSNDLRFANNKNEVLQSRLDEKDRPIVLQNVPDPEVGKIMERQEQEIAEMKNKLPSPKKKALQLSNDILKFLADRMKNQPPLPIPTSGMTREDSLRQRDEYSQLYVKWMQDTAADYQVSFGVTVTTIIDDTQAAGLSADNIKSCVYSNGNTFMIQECGSRIGALAEKLPQ